ncbi:hypothetical protein FGO68_gene7995 [Halteria grandinella]|uniref:Uncharacterized protein n=1 Tax=Halteria grandinella TaxID=5974 RepID=A0A8J8NUQ9_HALGN|nr:hypothetical protein FGO68_gene7995 [Halteria grandinella]
MSNYSKYEFNSTSALEAPSNNSIPYDELEDENVTDDSYVGKWCLNNGDCSLSTFCCSKKKCVPGSICYNGQKQVKDYCDYHFECLTRCCSNTTGRCTHFYECYSMCSSNSDCTSGCCSFGYCSHQGICDQGKKVDGDQCERDEECGGKNGKESECINKRCTPQDSLVSAHFVTMTAMVILFASALTILVYCCFQCLWGEKTPSDFDSDEDYGERRRLRRPLLGGEERGFIGDGAQRRGSQ